MALFRHAIARLATAGRAGVSTTGLRAAGTLAASSSSSSSSDQQSKVGWVFAGVAAAAGAALLERKSRSALAEGGGDAALLARIEKLEAQVGVYQEVTSDVKQATGEGTNKFSWDVGLTKAFPADAQPFEKAMHGGFNEDADTGIVYTGIPGYGLCQISPDLTEWGLVGSDSRLKANIHGIVVFKHNGRSLIAVAQNNDQRVLILDLDGKIIQELQTPQGGEFDFDEANGYYSERRRNRGQDRGSAGVRDDPTVKNVFSCTDVTYLDGRLYVVTGYCEGDFVLTASMDEACGTWRWGPTAWGGKGDAAGQFRTAHGIFAFGGHIYVANREAYQVIKFTKDGKLVETFPDIPDGSRICNVARANEHGYFVMNALAPLGSNGDRTAPIYAHSGDKIISTIRPGELGIPVLKHLHHVWPHYVTKADGSKQLYILMHGWRDGKYAVLKHEPEM